MSNRKTRRQFTVEPLERRETPSAGLGGSIHALARHPKPIVFSANGTVNPTSLTSDTVTLTSRTLGTLTGTFTITSSTTLTGTLTAGSNTVLDLAVQGKYTKGKTPHFHGTFTATSGSEVNGTPVTGKGTVNGSLNTTTDQLTVAISGRLTS